MNEFDFAKSTLQVGNKTVTYYNLTSLQEKGYGNFQRFPTSIKILIESLVRMQGHPAYTADHVKSLCHWSPDSSTKQELPFLPSRVLLQDFTGVPCVVDLASLRTAMDKAGKDPSHIEPMIPVDLIIDHSVQLDAAGQPTALDTNVSREYERNAERYRFLKWGQKAFEKLRVLPPGLGICHQINMEYLANCITLDENGTAYPDTLVGTDSHTTTINCMGVLGWGVGGIEAEAAMLGQPIPILTPEVIGFKLTGKLTEGITATDLALTVTQRLREKGVVGKFVEFYGEGAANLSLADRCPVSNMAPEYGATMGFFPIDEKTIDYLRETGRSEDHCTLVETYCKAQGLWRNDDIEPLCSDYLELDLSTVQPSIAGPKKPHERLTLPGLKDEFNNDFSPRDTRVDIPERGTLQDGSNDFSPRDTRVDIPERGTLQDGSIVIASITSCTNTSNPSLMMGAGLVAQKAIEKGLQVPATIKTSLAPGSQVVTQYLKEAGLLTSLEQLGFQVAAYGCATCIGNSGPCSPEIDQAIKENDLTVAAVLSGNRNFEGRVYPLTKANYLTSPPLVVAYAIAGTVNIDLDTEPLGHDADGKPVFLRDIWFTDEELAQACQVASQSKLYEDVYSNIEPKDSPWTTLDAHSSSCYPWDEDSTYIRNPSFFQDLTPEQPAPQAIEDATALAVFSDFITTDHISPAGNIPPEGPAGQYLQNNNVDISAFNSFGSRRGNHEVMMRGTFANIRIRNLMVEGEGGRTIHRPSSKEMSIYDAAMQYAQEKTPLIVLAGKMYGAGSSRDWAAKGTSLLGVKAVIAESFERIHRSNLVEMGVLPLEFMPGETAESLGLTGHETFTIEGVENELTPGATMSVIAKGESDTVTFQVKSRIDTPIEVDYYRHGGILQYVLRDIMRDSNC